MLALVAALVWPRPGQAALRVPLGGSDTRSVIARITGNAGLLRALGEGILPLAVRAPGCGTDVRR